MAEGEDQEAFEPITSQEELDRRIGERLRREREKVEARFADYEDVLARAKRLEELEGRSENELKLATERAAKAEAEAERARGDLERRDVLDRVSQETGVPASLLKGATEEELRASAEALAAFAKSQRSAYPSDKGAGIPGGARPVTEADIMAVKDPCERLRMRMAMNEGND